MPAALRAGLQRAASFGRKKERRSSMPAADTKSAATEKENDTGSKGLVSKVVRTASFRRRSTAGRLERARDEGATSAEEESTSGNSSPADHAASATSTTANTGGASAAGTPAPQVNVNAPLGALHGWLVKRHAKEKNLMNQWARRYFVVDDTRGTLSYMKSEHTKKVAPSRKPDGPCEPSPHRPRTPSLPLPSEHP